MAFLPPTLFSIRRWWPLSFPVLGWYIGAKLDNAECERQTQFRDKSALYGRQLAPGEKPSWP